MENRVPDDLAGQRLPTDTYIRNLSLIGAAGVDGISFTGGEPTLRSDLDRIIEGVRPHFDRVELTTNGARLDRVKDAVERNIDLIKVSLDSAHEAEVTTITGRAYASAHARAAIEWAVSEQIPLGINVVLMRRTIPELPRTIDYVRGIVEGGAQAPIHLSLLDFYYTPSRSVEWTRDFVPTSRVLDTLTNMFGEPVRQDRFGCAFYWFDAAGFNIRVKDSFGATMRAAKCHGCSSYCQEGIYGVKHSVEGWLTTCPSNRADLGVHLSASLDYEEVASRVNSVLSDVKGAAPMLDSFAVMCRTHGLTPDVIM
jgi:molybdenum cofactor biosynthesis enzyme MoaA